MTSRHLVLTFCMRVQAIKNLPEGAGNEAVSVHRLETSANVLVGGE